MAELANAELVIEFWDVGQGDASVVRLDNRRVFIIDVGPRNSPIIDWIAQNQSIQVEGIILTHNDADHAGALASVVEAARFRIGTVYFLEDRTRKDAKFQRLFSRLQTAHQAQEVREILSL